MHYHKLKRTGKEGFMAFKLDMAKAMTRLSGVIHLFECYSTKTGIS